MTRTTDSKTLVIGLDFEAELTDEDTLEIGVGHEQDCYGFVLDRQQAYELYDWLRNVLGVERNETRI